VEVADPPSAAAGGPSAVQLAQWLKPDRLVPIDGLIGELSRKQTQGLADPLAKARAIYDYVEATMRYDKTGTGWGRGDAVFACDNHRGNCTDFHSLFIGMARAAGIPAKFEIGFPLPPDRHEGEIPGYHCWAEFYTPKLGWVPVDASEAWQNPSRRDYYFGSHDPDRVQFTIGRDIRLNPPQQAAPLNYFIYPYAEIDGRPFDAVEHRFVFRDLPPTAARGAPVAMARRSICQIAARERG
jgi:transglutaminase-like putative cysteine protease